MANTCEAFYLPSNADVPVLFDFNYDFELSYQKSDYKRLISHFMSCVMEYGKTFPFPEDLVEQLGEDKLDLLLLDCESKPEHTFFLVDYSSIKLRSMLEDAVFKMCGCNNQMAAMESLAEGYIDVVRLSDVSTVYYRAEMNNKVPIAN